LRSQLNTRLVLLYRNMRDQLDCRNMRDQLKTRLALIYRSILYPLNTRLVQHYSDMRD
jgi:hypothetical protein